MKRFDADASRRIIFLSFVCSCLVVLWHAHFLGIAKKGTFVANRIVLELLHFLLAEDLDKILEEM